jgi:hypothetical protein
MIRKKVFFDVCNDVINDKTSSLSKSILAVEEDLNSATKSTAGDKHEVGRAMMHLELEKKNKHLAELNKNKQTLHLLFNEISVAHKSVKLGSLVLLSNHQYYFISLSLGKLFTSKNEFYAISPVTPLASLLLNKSVNDMIDFRGESLIIKELY